MLSATHLTIQLNSAPEAKNPILALSFNLDQRVPSIRRSEFRAPTRAIYPAWTKQAVRPEPVERPWLFLLRVGAVISRDVPFILRHAQDERIVDRKVQGEWKRTDIFMEIGKRTEELGIDYGFGFKSEINSAQSVLLPRLLALERLADPGALRRWPAARKWRTGPRLPPESS